MEHELNKEQLEFLDLLLDIKADYLGEPIKRLVNMQKLISSREKEIRKDQEMITIENFTKGKYEDALKDLNFRLTKIEKW